MLRKHRQENDSTRKERRGSRKNRTRHEYNILGLIGWWRSQEIDGKNYRKVRERDEVVQNATAVRKRRKQKEGEFFVRKFFPKCIRWNLKIEQES